MEQTFPADDLLDWYYIHRRELPWRETRNPYAIWVSEIMLQQTRVVTVIPYYQRFLARFPTVCDLANASLDDLMKLWEGLGYYRRAVHMHKAANTVCHEMGGKFPETAAGLQILAGIGTYTSAAIASIAYGEPVAAVDGNIYRVMARFYGLESDLRKTETQRQIHQLAQEALSKTDPGAFNQALMDLGSEVCTPSSPSCNSCPLSGDCIAFHQTKTDTIPYKSPAKKSPHHVIGVGVIRSDEGTYLIAKRPLDGMLGGLWEFPGGKKEPGETIQDCVVRELREELGTHVTTHKKLAEIDHAYSHFTITMHAYLCKIQSGMPEKRHHDELRWVTAAEMDSYSFPKANKVLIGVIKEAEEIGEAGEKKVAEVNEETSETRETREAGETGEIRNSGVRE